MIFVRRRRATTGPSPRSVITSTVAGLGRTWASNASNLYNFAPLNYFQRPDERYIGGVFADYEITPAIHPYLEFMFMDDHTLAQIAPSGDFGNTLHDQLRQSVDVSAHRTAQLCAPGSLT